MSEEFQRRQFERNIQRQQIQRQLDTISSDVKIAEVVTDNVLIAEEITEDIVHFEQNKDIFETNIELLQKEKKKVVNC